MLTFLEIDHIHRVFPLSNGGKYIALKNINLKIQKGEFISLLGHSGCGKSTLLNIVAGLDRPSEGGIVLEGKEITEPGPDRMVVFQNYSLLPWMSVRENIALGVDEIYKELNPKERKGIIESNIDLVGLRHAADKFPGELSGGMKQRVAIARAFALRPKLLLLDEPFGALDALTRGSLQDQLMKIAQQNEVTCLMVTHDADEALLLSDRIVMLTNGPEAHIGQIINVPIPRPRERLDVVNHPSYYALRNEIVYFLTQQKKAKKQKVVAPAIISGNGLEKVNLDIGFIPLTDCAPLIVAKEKGLFEDYGLSQVTLQREVSWKTLSEGITTGRLDAAQMVAGMPIAITMGIGVETPATIVSALTLSRNGNAITLSKKLYGQNVRTLADFKKAIAATPDKVPTLAIVHPTSMHNLMLRYWLASGGIDPDQDVNLIVIPPSQMVANLKAGSIDGYCVGEPWNSHAVLENVGFVIATDLDIWPGHVEKVLGVREDWAYKYPKTHVALVQALLEACSYCDDRRNREEIIELISQPDYLGIDPEYIRPGFLTPYDYGMGTEPELLLQYNRFHIDKTNCPDTIETLWMLTQMSRWGMMGFPRNWIEIIERVNRVDVYTAAAKQLNLPAFERERKPLKLFDGQVFDPDNPMNYIYQAAIKHPPSVQEFFFAQSLTEVS